MVRMHANTVKRSGSPAGDIAPYRSKDVTTGDPVTSITRSFWSVWNSIGNFRCREPKSKADREKMGIALGKLAQEDRLSGETAGNWQTIISGMGELTWISR